MKKVLTLFLFLIILSGVFAADSNSDKMFAKTMPILKIMAHYSGYKIYFYRTDLSIGVFYIPVAWLSESGGKAEVVWGIDTSYPYFSVFWKGGKFHHIKLFLMENMSDPSWGSLNATTEEVAQYFDVTPETFTIDFGIEPNSGNTTE